MKVVIEFAFKVAVNHLEFFSIQILHELDTSAQFSPPFKEPLVLIAVILLVSISPNCSKENHALLSEFSVFIATITTLLFLES